MSDFSRVMEIAREVTDAPVVVDAPAIMTVDRSMTAAKVGDTLVCTMGNWQGEPSAYDFAWRSDGVGIGAGGDQYVVRAEDQGHGIDCLVTASNIGGATSAPSNKINISGLVEEESNE